MKAATTFTFLILLILCSCKEDFEEDCIGKIDKNPNCPEQYDPVCGCNGVTYSNICFAEASGIRFWDSGACGPQGSSSCKSSPIDTICSTNYDPVCGCDGLSYSNACLALKNGIIAWEQGSCNTVGNDCITTRKQVDCSDDYAPVCGCNGVTYLNECHALNAGLITYNVGACDDINSCRGPYKDIECEMIFIPVCGCDGLTYLNECHAMRFGVKTWKAGSCDYINSDCNGDEMDLVCTTEYDPVCGCNGTTYSNECFAINAGVKTWTKGECGDVNSDCIGRAVELTCTDDYDPVCGCNGVTYSNECYAARSGVVQWEKGECGASEDNCVGPSKSIICAADYDPVCGCNGVTYSNECYAEAAGVKTWTQGECGDPDSSGGDCIGESITCFIFPTEYDPVCGCDGKTYRNVCYASLAGVQNWAEGACEGGESGDDCIGSPTGTICTGLYDPVCGCDGETYSNACYAEAAGVKTWTKGECDGNGSGDNCKGSASSIICSDLYDPVCGCDGETYSNACYAETAGVKTWTSGECDGNGSGDNCKGSASSIICTGLYDPVCGCDGETYSNACYAEAAGVKTWTRGECDGNGSGDNCKGSASSITCTDLYDPVCGCDGETYSNACYAEAAGIKTWTRGECGG